MAEEDEVDCNIGGGPGNGDDDDGNEEDSGTDDNESNNNADNRGGRKGGGGDNANAGTVQNLVRWLLIWEDGIQCCRHCRAHRVLLANTDCAAAPPNYNDAPPDGNWGGMVQRRG
jgi:hypothetical protein